ncbi:hypothetical protein BDV12DRAFT_203282 [Aspergillus spectabilis]
MLAVNNCEFEENYVQTEDFFSAEAPGIMIPLRHPENTQLVDKGRVPTQVPLPIIDVTEEEVYVFLTVAPVHVFQVPDGESQGSNPAWVLAVAEEALEENGDVTGFPEAAIVEEVDDSGWDGGVGVCVGGVFQDFDGEVFELRGGGVHDVCHLAGDRGE